MVQTLLVYYDDDACHGPVAIASSNIVIATGTISTMYVALLGVGELRATCKQSFWSDRGDVESVGRVVIAFSEV